MFFLFQISVLKLKVGDCHAGFSLNFLEFILDLTLKSGIMNIAFSFFAPAFLFLLPSLRKKAGVL